MAKNIIFNQLKVSSHLSERGMDLTYFQLHESSPKAQLKMKIETIEHNVETLFLNN
ncbi:hypothetical protein LEP1GSC151_0554 [Leptospira interrogans serovar Grippotyphosa str. LT2186]|uniref:Uncharacterized protein n=1 Tax=Leptospira interrogans serovar Grippotyphosa str. LT2186 TaxID=1001599 RepID=M3IAC8_LEPIR|nr:hypothetical protein LEP1GSC009_3600 [Leptospira interrogans serovar Grippotyphosa str. Andaman]EKP87332.1 hypothetical protein LEP1GSC020_2026 [Leptospira interrogans serovar Grippotyphosa str. 2006006986]EKR46641.1 hypothetical protein LEP1GSC097_0069 [Leptospira interrogans serovar Grippotyphosa str. UI 08368]EMG12336.1 hypothetical protein LEP1GSC151_0554 [Leptospira interrogans serovar Grippotyphosa str. LT2186]EMN85611.1 hypothetical protein LEP1GSC107_0135 [Leptospira interrogans sero